MNEEQLEKAYRKGAVIFNKLVKDEHMRIANEFSDLGILFTAVMLLMGNLIFGMLDKILTRITVMDKRGRK